MLRPRRALRWFLLAGAVCACRPDFVESRFSGRPLRDVIADLYAPSSYAGSRTTLKVGLGESNSWELMCAGNLGIDLEDQPGRHFSVREGVAVHARLEEPTPGEGGVCPELEITADVDTVDPKSVTAAFAGEGDQPRIEVTGVKVADDSAEPGAALDLRKSRLVLGPCRAPDEVERICRRFIDTSRIACTADAGIKTPPGGTLVLSTAHGIEIARWAGPARLHCEGSDTVYLLHPDWDGKRRGYRDGIVLTAGPGGQVLAVNEVGLENYVKGVVPSEISPEAPDQALEAQAVVARTAALARLGDRHADRPFDPCDDIHCQPYRGLANATSATETAVDATRGLVLVHEGGLVDAAYTPDCGGITEANEVAWPKQPPDPTFRPRLDAEGAGDALPDFSVEANLLAFLLNPPATFCARGAKPGEHRWTRSFTAEELTALVSGDAGAQSIGRVRGLRIEGRGASGRATALVIEGASASRRIEGEAAIRHALGDLPSSAFAVQTVPPAGSGDPAVFVLIGAGQGNGVGLCQNGAIGMALAKASLSDIVAHYYVGAHAARLLP